MVKVIFNIKSKVHEINSHGERGIAGSPNLFGTVHCNGNK